MAASYLIGISAGAVLSAFVQGLFRHRFRAYALTLIAIGTSATVVTTVLLRAASGQIPFFFGQLLLSWPLVSRILMSMLLLMIPTICIGMAFPMATTIWNDRLGKPAQSTALIYAVALVGNLIGVLSVGFYLIPTFGLQIGMLALTSICAVGGLLLLFISLFRQSFRLRLTLHSLALFGSVGLMLTIWAVGSGRLYRQFWPIGVTVHDGSDRLDFYAEGAVNTVAVVSQRRDPAARRMIVDGVTIGENRGGVDEKQQMLAHLPFLTGSDRPGQRVITIGLGTGILAGQLAQISQVEQVWAVELSPGVIAASEWFAADNNDILHHPRARIVRADGIRFLRTTELRFDAIVSDAKSRPGYAGNIPFFSRDYYELCRQRLVDDGQFLQWVSLDSSPDSIAVILQTFADVFPFGHIAIAAPDSIYLVGTIKPLQLSRRQIEQHLATTSASSLKRYNWMSYDDFLSLYWLDQQTVQAVFRGQGHTRISTLDHPVLEACAGADTAIGTGDNRGPNLEQLELLLRSDAAEGFESSSLNAQPLQSLESVPLVTDLTSGRQAAMEIIRAEQRQLQLLDGWLDAAAEHYTTAIGRLPDLNRQRKLAALYRQLVKRAQTSGDINREFSALVMINRLKAGTAADQHRVAEILMGLGRPEDAVPYFYQAAAMQPGIAAYQNDLAFCLLQLGKHAQALARFRRVLALSPEDTRGHLGLGITLAHVGQMDSARPHLRRAGESSFELRQMIEDYGIPWDRVLAGSAAAR